MKYEKATITIRADQKEWLKNHPEFNLSGIVQRCIDDRMKKEQDQ